MKKLISLVLIATMLFSVMPTLVSASTTEPDGTVIMYNSTSSKTETGFSVKLGANASTISAAGTAGATFIDSYTTSGYNNTTPIAIGNSYNAQLAAGTQLYRSGEYKPAQGTLSAGLYEVYFWNICQIDATEKFLDTTKAPLLSRNVTYTVTTNPTQGTGSANPYYTSKHDFDPATASGGTNGWVSLGKFYFGGTGDETVSVTKFSATDDYLYMSAIKFVPVTASSDSVGIERIYATTFTTQWKAQAGNERNTTADVKDGVVTFSNMGANQVNFTVIASDPNAKVSFDGGTNSTVGYRQMGVNRLGTPFMDYTDATTSANSKVGKPIQTTYVTITSADGNTQKTYPFTLEYENGTATVLTLDANSDKASSAKDSGKGSVDGSAMHVTCIGTTKKVWVSTNLGDTVAYTPNLASAGFYNVYAYNTAPMKVGAAREVLATVTHNGIKEQTKIPFGGAVEGDWTPIGKFYFAGGANEKITLTNIVDSADVTNFSEIKLVSALEDPLDKALRGISVTANGETQGVLAESADGYIMPLPVGDYTTADIKVDAGSAVTAIKVNGEDATANVAKPITIGDKDNIVTVAVTTASGTTNYKLNLYKQMKERKIGAAADAAADTSSLYYSRGSTGIKTTFPLDIDGTGDSLYDFYTHPTYVPAAEWHPHIEESYGTDSRAFHILLWKPALGSVNGDGVTYGKSDLKVKINNGGYVYNTTVDWLNGNSEWINLGTYIVRNTKIDALGVVLESNIPEHILVDELGVAFLETEVPTGLAQVYLGGSAYKKDEINGKTISTSGLRDMHFISWNATDKIYVNSEEWASGTAMGGSYAPGVNRYEVVIKDADGNITDTCSFKVLSESYTVEAKNAAQTGTWATAAGYTGVNGSNVLSNSAVGDSLAYRVGNNSKGNADVYVYRHLAEDTISGTASVTVGDTNIGEITNNASNSAGWVKVGNYDFKGAENITLTVTNGTILADAVKIVYTGTIYVSPVILETQTGYKAIADVYQTTNDNITAKLFIAKYTNDGEFVALKSAPLTLNGNGSASADTAEIAKGNGIYRTFLWNDAIKLTPLTEDSDVTILETSSEE